MPISIKQAQDVITYGPEQDPIAVMSPPGTGKSAGVIVPAARRMGRTYLPVYAATMEAIESRGLPLVAEQGGHKLMQWAAPTTFPLAMLREQYGPDAKFLVNLDDFPQAPPPVLRAFVRSIYGDGAERKLGDFPIHSGVRFVITGNRETDRAGASKLDTYVADRITFIEVQPTVEDWTRAAMAGFALPGKDEEYDEKRARVNAAVEKGIPDELVAYVQWSKEIYAFTTEARSFLSPRSIERLGRFIRAMDAVGIDGDVLQEVASGTIGEAQAVKYMAFHHLRSELPDIDAILAGKDVKLPPKPDILFITAVTVLRAAKAGQAANVGKFITNMSKLTKNGQPVGVEPSVFMVQEALRGSAVNLRGVREFLCTDTQWFKDNAKYFA